MCSIKDVLLTTSCQIRLKKKILAFRLNLFRRVWPHNISGLLVESGIRHIQIVPNQIFLPINLGQTFKNGVYSIAGMGEIEILALSALLS